MSSKLIKYKIKTAKLNKKLITDEIGLERIRTKKENDDNKGRSKPKAPAWFVEFEKRNIQRFDRLENNISNLNNRFDNLVKVNNLKE